MVVVVVVAVVGSWFLALLWDTNGNLSKSAPDFASPPAPAEKPEYSTTLAMYSTSEMETRCRRRRERNLVLNVVACACSPNKTLTEERIRCLVNLVLNAVACACSPNKTLKEERRRAKLAGLNRRTHLCFVLGFALSVILRVLLD